jgi:hypothetical protein
MSEAPACNATVAIKRALSSSARRVRKLAETSEEEGKGREGKGK